jgi:RNA polymerase sigma factor (sigma-70 family)
MAGGQSGDLSRHLSSLFRVGTLAGVPDAQLLERFVAGRDEAGEAAFRALVERHGPMVLRVCQNVLGDRHDSEDAFQVTFLVLARNAGSIRKQRSLGSWLHGVAHRVALRAQTAARRRRIHERKVLTRLETATPGAEPGEDLRDQAAALHQEIAHLPEKYRAPIVLCYLEGHTHEGAAEQLGWPVGTVRGRLARARDLLRARLTRRGVMTSVGLAVIESLSKSARAALPTALCEATVGAAVRIAAGQTVGAVASARIEAWVSRVAGVMNLCRWNTFAGLSLAFGALCAGLGLVLAGVNLPVLQPPKVKSPPSPVVRDGRAANLREMLQLKGTWTSQETETSSIDYVPQPPKTVKIVWSVDRDMITESGSDGFAQHTYRFTVDSDRRPESIDLTMLNTGLELRGIYKLDGETLTICEGLERPRSFEKDSQFLRIFHRVSRTPTQLAPEYENAPGCYWACAPAGGIPSSLASGGINYIVQKDPQGAMLVSLAFVAKLENGEPNVEYRPVAVDDMKKRYLFQHNQGGGWSGSAAFPGIVLAHYGFRLDPAQLPFDRVRQLGIEVVPAEVTRAAAVARSALAFQEARAAGIELLPPAELGKPFAFSLTDSQHQSVSSATLEGKVVLIDIWASWRSPCMGKATEVKALYERRHRDGFEVIGVIFEDNRARTERLIKAMALPWPQVFVPEDERTRRLWNDGPGLRGTPKLLLIDRGRILRWAGGPEGLEKRITDLLDAPR